MTMEIKLPLALEKFVKDNVARGLYSSEDEVVADAVRRLAERDADLELSDEDAALLRQAWDEGVAGGAATPLDIEQVISDAKTNWNPIENAKGRAA